MYFYYLFKHIDVYFSVLICIFLCIIIQICIDTHTHTIYIHIYIHVDIFDAFKQKRQNSAHLYILHALYRCLEKHMPEIHLEKLEPYVTGHSRLQLGPLSLPKY